MLLKAELFYFVFFLPIIINSLIEDEVARNVGRQKAKNKKKINEKPLLRCIKGRNIQKH